MNYVKKISVFRNFIDRKNLTKFFILIMWQIVEVSKRMVLIVDLDEN